MDRFSSIAFLSHVVLLTTTKSEMGELLRVNNNFFMCKHKHPVSGGSRYFLIFVTLGMLECLK